MANAQDRARKLAYARRMVDKLETALFEQDGGVVQVSTDGVSVTYARAEGMKELEYWRKQVQRYGRNKSRTSSIRLDNGI